ncbi:transposable element gene [Prunus dulcis]|uniref:Transposable element protein n=1 Tax=Prunus dulcis TaxID=3755 RepID=A0A4Y1QXI3_PRUDU|nr:transposable element gene [Prunus dulcis]
MNTNAFLHGELEEEVYMSLPPGHPQKNKEWFVNCTRLSTDLSNLHRLDSSLFVKDGPAGRLVVLIYVDDLIITSSNMRDIHKLKSFLHKKFAIKDLGSLKYFLGIGIASSSKGLFLNQHNKLSKPIHAFSSINSLQAVKWILRYLKGSIGRGILMRKNGNNQIIGYSDADCAGCQIDQKSTTGYCTFVGGNLVTWKSKKQSVVARSSADAEYRAMAAVSCELIWVQGLLNDLGFKDPHPMTLFCDNQAAIHIASNPVFHERTKLKK